MALMIDVAQIGSTFFLGLAGWGLGSLFEQGRVMVHNVHYAVQQEPYSDVMKGEHS